MRPGETRTLAWGWAVLLTAVFGVAISGDSLWIDEALTATKAQAATLGEWWQRMSGEKMSDLQMPLYMGLVWLHAKVFGAGEWALRMFNLPWLVAGGVAFLQSFPERRHRLAAGLVVLTSPFAWTYLNEARPYAMQLGGVLLILAALQAMSGSGTPPRPSSVWYGVFCFGLVVLGGSNLLGMIWVVGAGGAMVACLNFSVTLGLFQRNRTLTLATAFGLGWLSVYYMWTLHVGARASAVAGTGWGNLVFAGYELTGFMGLGPGRLQLRELGALSLHPFYGWLAVYAGLLGLVLFRGLQALPLKAKRGQLLGLAACAAGPGFVIVSVAMVAHFRLLGRHLTPLAGIWFWVATSGLAALAMEPQWWKRGAAGLLVSFGLASCLALRFAPRHAHDDYRNAAERARLALAQGQVVWWSAAHAGAEYYHVPTSAPPGKPGSALELINVTPADLAHLPGPGLVVGSKPDLHDAAGALAGYLATNRFKAVERLPGFTLWGPDTPTRPGLR